MTEQSGNKSLKLAFAVSLFFEFGGMQRTLLRIARECVRRGHEVHIFTGGWLGAEPQDLTVHELDTRAMTNTRSNDILAKALKSATHDAGFDCIVGFTKIPGLDVYYAGDPCYAARIDENKGFWYKLFPRYHAFRRQEAAVFSPKSNTEYLLIAHQERDKFVRYYGTPAERFHLLPPGINRDRLHDVNDSDRARLRQDLGITDDEQMVLLVGSRFKTKGVDRAIKAIAALPEELLATTKLVIVGGDRSAAYEWLARRKGVRERVVFTGAQADMARFYHSADLLLHPPYSENTGTILIEAMYCGLPVLTTANCGFAFHVEQAGAGCICPMPFDQETLNRYLANMLQSSNVPEWRQRGREYCQKHDLYSLIERAADIIIERAIRNRDQS